MDKSSMEVRERIRGKAREKAKFVLDRAESFMRQTDIRAILDLDIDDRRAVGVSIMTQIAEICGVKEEKILLLGIAPSKGRASEGAWSGRQATENLARLLGLHTPELRQHFKLRNVYKTETYPKNKRETEVYDSILDEKLVIILGREAAYCLGLEKVPWLTPHYLDLGPTIVVVPHPSGLCRWWNDPANVERAEMFFAGVHTIIGLR